MWALLVNTGAKKIGAKKKRRDFFPFYMKKFGFKNSGLTLEFRSLVGIGRSGGMIGRCCLNMVLKFQHGSEL